MGRFSCRVGDSIVGGGLLLLQALSSSVAIHSKVSGESCASYVQVIGVCSSESCSLCWCELHILVADVLIGGAGSPFCAIDVFDGVGFLYAWRGRPMRSSILLHPGCEMLLLVAAKNRMACGGPSSLCGFLIRFLRPCPAMADRR
ncbi:hypothetical protein BS78_02G059300 [Paspalum vaginatum]|nr:hypothetical protein BS78_02G059300 [Paspalum vaginatum]